VIARPLRRRTTAALALAALLALPAAAHVAVPAAAQEPESSTTAAGLDLAGVVTTAACTPAAGVPVRTGGDDPVTGRTGEDGAFRLEGLAAGDYEVTAGTPSPRFETATVAVELDDDTDELDIVLDHASRPVTRVAGDSRVLTALAASARAHPDGAATVVIASSGAFPDALAAAPLATALEGPLLLVDRRSGAAVLDEVERLGADEAVVVGAIDGVTAVVGAELRAAGVDVRRIAGEDRFDTAALVAREVGAPDGEVAIATGAVFADALSFAPVAAAHGIPILLTGSAALPRDTEEALDDLDAERAIVLGGTDAVSEAVAAELPDPVRVAGDDRYATSVAIAGLAVERGADLATVYAATGRDYPDALAAGPVAAGTDGVVVLVDGADAVRTAAVVYGFLAEHLAEIDDLVAFGGVAAIDGEVEELLAAPGLALGECGERTPAPETRTATVARGRLR